MNSPTAKKLSWYDKAHEPRRVPTSQLPMTCPMFDTVRKIVNTVAPPESTRCASTSTRSRPLRRKDAGVEEQVTGGKPILVPQGRKDTENDRQQSVSSEADRHDLPSPVAIGEVSSPKAPAISVRTASPATLETSKKSNRVVACKASS